MDQPLDIKSLRKSIGWNQDRLARYLGVDRSSVSRLERRTAHRGPMRILLDRLVAAAADGSADSLCPELEAAE